MIAFAVQSLVKTKSFRFFKLESGIYVHSVQKECTQCCPTDIKCCPQNRDFKNLVSLHVTCLKTGFLLTYLTEGGVMTKIHSPAGLSFLSPVKIGAPPSEKVSWSLP